MSAMHVYVVEAYVMYESTTIVAGFVLERDARAFAQRCKDHDAKKPRCPELSDSDEAWELYDRREKNWTKRHPAKRTVTADDYPVTILKIRPAIWPKPSKSVD